MIKLASHKHFGKLAKSTLAIVFAGSFTLSASQVFADETTSQQNNYPTVDLQSGTDAGTNTTATTSDTSQETQATQTDADTSQTAPAQTETATDTNTTTETQDHPSLLPGDFFYFVKIAFEKIQLALTFNQVKQAKLLAGFATERLAEAHALLESGSQQTAIDTIKQALEDMKDADKIVDSQKQAETTTKDDSEQADGQNADTNTSATDNTSSTDQVQGDDQAKEDNNIEEINHTISQNIAALTAAMDKVKNPVAKAALERNIEKSYAKLAERMLKLTAHAAKTQTETAENSATDQNAASGDNSTGTAAAPANANTGSSNGSTVSVTSPEGTAAQTIGHKPAEKQFHQEVKQIKQIGKQDLKQIKQDAKLQVKQKREEIKTFVEAKKTENKHAENEHNGNHD